ncbi:MAG: hypothetical protein RI894_1445 [Bacteroidota bacterium]|jgi:hypothetical protein
MSKFDDALDSYKAIMTEAGFAFDETLLTSVTKGLGPSIYNRDAAYVAGTDPEELTRVKNNYLVGKLGLEDSADLDAAIATVMQSLIDAGVKARPRAVVYYLLCKHFGKESIYA